MNTTGHTSRAKDPAIVREAQKPIEFISKVLGWIATSIAILAIVLLVRGCVSEHAEKKAKAAQKAATYAAAHLPAPIVAPKYPTHGEGHATKEVGLKAWLDPKKTHVHPSRPARYTFVQDPTLSWDDCAGARVESNSSKHVRVWLEEMPAGEYTIRPINEGDRIFFRWWQ